MQEHNNDEFSKPLKLDFEVSRAKEEIEEKSKNTVQNPKTELHYLLINTLAVITNGFNHFHMKYMKKSIKEQYEDYSFTIFRCFFIVLFNSLKMMYLKESLTPLNSLKTNVWFWIRVIDQFVALQTMLLLLSFFRVSTATCFISMAPVVIVIMSVILLGEKFYLRYIYGIILCFCGVLLIVKNEENGDSDEEENLGFFHLFCGFICGLSQLIAVGFHRVSSKVLINEKIDLNIQLIYPSIGCIILSIIFLPLSGKEFKYSFWLIFHSFVNCIIWLLSTTLMLVSFKGVDLIKTTAIGYLNIVTVFILGATFLNEHLYFTDILGSLIILGFNIYNTMYPPTS